MRIYLLRHGRTSYNAEHRYQGRSDIPLSPEGEKELVQADFEPDRVCVSPLCRARRTAEVLFPYALQIPVEELTEMDFGAFEGRNYIEMEHDTDYRSWVDGGCVGRCPGGEDLPEFCERVCAAFEKLLDQARREERERLVVVAHGGVQMAVMARYALPEKGYFDWFAPCGGGFVLDDALWAAEHKLELIEEVNYTRKA